MENKQKKSVSILGIPFWGGQPKAGVDEGPAAIREAGLGERLQRSGLLVTDLGDIDTLPPPLEESQKDPSNAKRAAWVGNVTRSTSETIAEHVRNNPGDSFIVNLGGDHSVAIGTLSGLLEAYQNEEDGSDLCVLWVDAHADINTPEVSTSGNIHGMPVAFAAKDSTLLRSWEVPGFEWLGQTRNKGLNLKKLAYVGLRDVDPAEKVFLARYNVRCYYMQDVQEKGITKVMDEVMEYFEMDNFSNKNHLHLSFDIDGIDAEACPATGTAVGGGLTVEDALHIARRCGQSSRLVAMDLVEVNPALSDAPGVQRTVSTAVALIEAALCQ